MLGRIRFSALAALAALWCLLPCAASAQNTTKMLLNPTASQVDFPPDPAGAIAAARGKIAADDMHGAISYLQIYVSIHPNEIAPRRFLGDLYFRTGQVQRAQQIYQAILRNAPGDKETHNRLGTVYAEENHVEAAIREFEAALPGTDSVNDLVELHRRKGDLGAYEQRVEQLANMYPTDPGTQAELGQLDNAIHDPAEAIVAFNRALDESRSDLTALNGLGLAYLHLKQYPDAVATFQRCLRVDPTLYQCTNNLGAAQLQAGDDIAAKATLERAYHLGPEHGETYVNFGYLDDAEHHWQQAAAEYAKAIEVYPYLREAYIDLALDYEHHQLYVLAQAVLIKGIASVYDDGRLHVLLGDAYQAQGDRADALAQFKLGKDGSNPEAVTVATERLGSLLPAPSASPR